MRHRVARCHRRPVHARGTAYAFANLALLLVPQGIQGGLLAFVKWVSQTFIQLVAHVPVLVVPAAS